ncbi:Endoribonuclease L-PSP/chorismate mutase-like protein [Aspergillus keveii]|uniref:Endoribonuclease L-PSP/chorismate mutase-like protein n=1 Tax=Aspergillus keveii TaxID=714993 RepID=A0ABR4FVZ2_9EURO
MPGQFTPVFTSSAPTPLPQFSQAVVYNGLVYCSGNIGIKPGAAFELVEGTAKDRTVSHIRATLCLSPSNCSTSTLTSLIRKSYQSSQRQILTNIRAVLEAAGSSLDNVLKMNIFLTNMDNFGIINEAYDEFFTQAIKPARTCVAVYQLPFGTDVEIECTAHLERQ